MGLNLTNQELIILLVLIIAIGGFLCFLFKSIFKIIVSIMIVMVVWSIGFNWLPNQIDRIQKGEATTNQVIDEVKNSLDESGVVNSVKDTANNVGNYIDKNKGSWIASFGSLMSKLMGNSPEVPQTNNTTNDTINTVN